MISLGDFLTVTAEFLGLLILGLTLKKEILQLKLLQKQTLDTSKTLESCVCRDPQSRTRSTD
jgi:hypothetical protein